MKTLIQSILLLSLVTVLQDPTALAQQKVARQKTERTHAPVQTPSLISTVPSLSTEENDDLITQEGNEYLFSQARISFDWVRRVILQNRTVFLNQEFIYFRTLDAEPFKVKRHYVLHKGSRFGEDFDTFCAIVVTQRASVTRNGQEITSKEESVEIPNCGKIRDKVEPIELYLTPAEIVPSKPVEIAVADSVFQPLRDQNDRWLREQEEIRKEKERKIQEAREAEAKRIEDARLAEEAAKRAEEERIAAEAKAKAERIEAERIANEERLAAAKIAEAERIAAAERARIEAVYAQSRAELEKVRKLVNKNLAFPIPLDPYVCLMIDGSGSIDTNDSVTGLSFRDLARQHAATTISLLMPMQMFTVGVTHNRMFNDGVPVNATPENVQAAQAWILSNNSKGDETFDDMLAYTLEKGKRMPDKIMIFTDCGTSDNVGPLLVKQLGPITSVDIAPLANSYYASYISKYRAGDITAGGANFIAPIMATGRGSILPEVHNLPNEVEVQAYREALAKAIKAAEARKAAEKAEAAKAAARRKAAKPQAAKGSAQKPISKKTR